VFPWITLDHCSELINFGNEFWAEAIWIQNNRVITVHASLDASQVLVRLVEPEGHCLVVDQVRNMREVMLVWLLVVVETFPELSI